MSFHQFSPLLLVLASFLIHAPLTYAQTAWRVAYTIDDDSSNESTRVAFSNGAFHVAWQGDTQGYSDELVKYYTTDSDTPPAEVQSYELDNFALDNLAFEIDGTTIFTGSNLSGYLPMLADDPLEQGEYATRYISPSYYTDRVSVSNIIAGDGVYVAGLRNTKNASNSAPFYPLAISTDLDHWTLATLPAQFSITSIEYANGRFVALGYSTASYTTTVNHSAILTSVNGSNWTITTISNKLGLRDVIYTGSEWIAVGDESTVYSSLDGFIWEQTDTTGLYGDLTAVASGNGYLVVGTQTGEIFTSTNGIDYLVQAENNAPINDIAAGNSLFMVATGLDILVSDFAPVGVADITEQPSSAYIIPGEQVTLSVMANGDSPLTYQWYAGVSGDTSTPIIGATSTTFQTDPLFQTEQYWVQVTNSKGQENSLTAVLTLQTPPAITTQPEGAIISMGNSLSIAVGATGENLSYQWYTGSAGDTTTPLSGKNSYLLNISSNTPGQFYYWARVSNDLGQVDSITVGIEIAPVLPVISEQPLDLTVYVDQFYGSQLYVDATGPGRSYQWYQGVSGDTSNPISPSGTSFGFRPSDDVAGVFLYWVRASNAAGYSDSRTVTFTVLPLLPLIVNQPQDQWITDGKSGTIRVSVVNRSGTTYQWYEGSSGDTSTPITTSGNSSSLFRSNLSAGDYRYWVRITNPDGSIDSDHATLHVTPTTYASWLSREGLPANESGDGDSTATLEGDAIPNLLRYLLGANSRELVTGTAAYSTNVITVNEEPYLSIQFTVLKDASDATLHVEQSTDMITWTESTVQVSAHDNGDGTISYVYRSDKLSDASPCFLRLRAAQL